MHAACLPPCLHGYVSMTALPPHCSRPTPFATPHLPAYSICLYSRASWSVLYRRAALLAPQRMRPPTPPPIPNERTAAPPPRSAAPMPPISPPPPAPRPRPRPMPKPRLPSKLGSEGPNREAAAPPVRQPPPMCVAPAAPIKCQPGPVLNHVNHSHVQAVVDAAASYIAR